MSKIFGVHAKLAETDWQAYTATFTAGFGTVATQNCYFRRIGDTLELKGTFTTGTTANSVLRISIPSGLSFDTTKMTLPSLITGTMSGANTATNGVPTAVQFFIASGQTANISLTSVANGSGAQNMVELNGSTILNNSTQSSFSVSGIPISGWKGSDIVPATP